MTVSEDQRFRMHQELRKVLGDEVGNTVMEHLPPLGWGDVARTKDIDNLADRMTQIDQRHTMRTDSLEERLTSRIDGVEERLSMRIDFIETRLKSITTTLQVMIGAMVTVSTGIIVMLIQINQNISNL